VILLFTINPGLEIVGLLPSGVVGNAYTATLAVRGGLAPYTIEVVSTLPAGLSWVDNGDGTLTISGTPTVTFSGSVQVEASDGTQKAVQKTLQLVVIEPPPIAGYLLWEDGSFLLWEDGGKIII
jgi:hypothetical protein